MIYETIIAQTLDGNVACVTLNCVEAMNTFSSQMAQELYDALKEFDAAPDVRVILIKGAGRAFCAGIDVNELKGKTTNQYREWIEKMEAPLVLISKMQTPVITQVHGAAAANGMGLVAARDLTKKSPIAVKIAKSAFYASRDMPYEAQFAYMNEAFDRLCDTKDAKEGVAAFFEKRTPMWQEK